MFRSTGLALMTALALAGAARPAAKGPYRPPEEALKLFVDELVPITPGKGKFPASFEMGSARGGSAAERPVVKVTFRHTFSVARYEVTQELYKAVMGKNPAKWEGPRNSVEMVNWDEANAFCAKLTKMLRDRKLIAADDVVRLPSEAEWEYVCRASTKTKWSFGDDEKEIGDYAWYKVNAPGNDPPVGRKRANPWGLYDVHGYVSEWCADRWSPTLEGTPTDGRPRTKGSETEHVIRGGSFADLPDAQRSAYRDRRPSGHRDDKVGFRCVVSKAPGKE